MPDTLFAFYMRFKHLLSLSAAILAVAGITTASAVSFPDVPSDHLFREAVEQLVSAGAINGNPDGNFYPDRAVNRAEMLKMLYLAAGITPDPANMRCFPDVQPDSWYESFVCDAATRRFVSGYNDGFFRPQQDVNRVEALKMIQEVFGFDVGEMTDYDRDIINFVDVSVSAWYTKYLFNAYSTGILPIVGQESSYFRPEQALKRGEAAAMIFNALYANIQERRELQSTSDGSDDEQQSGDDAGDDDDAATATGSSSAGQAADIRDAAFPFEANGKFDAKKTTSFAFDISSATVASIVAGLQSGQPGMIRCVLYLLDEDGFSEQYYIGTEEGRTCELLVALTPGTYQLQLQPTQPDVTFTVTAQTGQGDGNDGFSESRELPINQAKTHTIPANNFQNWYTFRVTQDEGRRLKVELSNTTELSCVIYAMDDVDLFGFTGPECNQFYTFPFGTYHIAVSREAPKASPQTYTLIMRE